MPPRAVPAHLLLILGLCTGAVGCAHAPRAPEVDRSRIDADVLALRAADGGTAHRAMRRLVIRGRTAAIAAYTVFGDPAENAVTRERASALLVGLGFDAALVAAEALDDADTDAARSTAAQVLLRTRRLWGATPLARQVAGSIERVSAARPPAAPPEWENRLLAGCAPFDGAAAALVLERLAATADDSADAPPFVVVRDRRSARAAIRLLSIPETSGVGWQALQTADHLDGDSVSDLLRLLNSGDRSLRDAALGAIASRAARESAFRAATDAAFACDWRDRWIIFETWSEVGDGDRDVGLSDESLSLAEQLLAAPTPSDRDIGLAAIRLRVLRDRAGVAVATGVLDRASGSGSGARGRLHGLRSEAAERRRREEVLHESATGRTPPSTNLASVEGVESLRVRTATGTGGTRAEALERLLSAAPLDAAVLTALRRIADDDTDPDTQTAAAAALLVHGHRDPRLFDCVAATLRLHSAEFRDDDDIGTLAAFRAAERLRADAAPLADALITHLVAAQEGPHPDAIRAIASLGSAAGPCVAGLRGALFDDDYVGSFCVSWFGFYDRDAVRLLAALGPDAESAVPDIRILLTRPHIADDAAAALARIRRRR